MWDLRKGKTLSTLTYHKKSIRAMAAHPQEFAFAAASADNIKKYRLPQVESFVAVTACCPGKPELVQKGAPACCSVCCQHQAVPTVAGGHSCCVVPTEIVLELPPFCREVWGLSRPPTVSVRINSL